MGNSPSTAQKPVNRAANDIPPRREPKRRESVHALPSTSSKATPAPPSASLETSHTRDLTKPAAHSRNRSATIATPHARPGEGPDKSAMEQPEVENPSPATKPIDAPTNKAKVAPFEPSPLQTSVSVQEPYNLPAAGFARPPRLPLPIEEEVHTPGSPILSPSDAPLEEVPSISANSVISSNADDEDEPDEFLGYTPEAGANVSKIMTLIEWRDGTPSDKVYVTGTFAGWERKFRLHWDGPSKHPNTLSTTLQLPPGTHHLKFLVNNDMQVSPQLPTTVDFTNILVNYIEVAQPTTAPVAVPAPATKPMEIRNKQTSDTASPMRTSSPATRTAGATASPSAAGARSSPKPAKGTQIAIKKGPPKQYTSQIPSYLLDLDTWPPPTDSPESSADESSAAAKYHRATSAANAQPEPPSLPLFLSKSILNSATPMKDDSSVLVLPNHTVLNHLSTTSIRAGVLASSCTCRYKQRFLTTIFYRPRGEDAE
ncbi:hypothetical protein ANO11243_047400 [Dothideomycetidae sp. 11243]|nr:hypothetical protein ANO11243_047400 [fungal sp. No.11243]